MTRTALLLVAFIAIIGSVSSCKKTEPCNAVITVLDSLDRPVVGATVVVRQDSVVNTNGVQADIYQESTTAANGQAYFEFKWEAVLNVEVTYDSVMVRDYIRLEQSETVAKTIYIN